MTRAHRACLRGVVVAASALALTALQLPFVPPASAALAVTGERCTIVGTPGDDVLYGTEGPDVICGRGGEDRVQGGGGDDVIDVTTSRGIAAGGDGNDRIYVGPGVTRAWGGPGDDVMIGSPGQDDLIGGTGNDRLWGAAGNDTLWGAEDDDRIVGGDGLDGLWGGSGDDVLLGGPGHDGLRGEAGDDRLEGGPDADSLGGGDGRDVLLGGGGNDSFTGGDGSDVVSGGTGLDTMSYAASRTPVHVTLDGVADDGRDGEADLVRTDVEIVRGGHADDVIVGSSHADKLYGMDGDDVLIGRGGADTLSGGKGTDEVSYAGRSAPVSLTLNGIRDDGAAGERDLVSADVENLTGGEAGDLLVGDAKDNVLRGRGGRDVLVGGLGVDAVTYSERVTAVHADLDGASDDGVAGERDKVSTTVEGLIGGAGDDVLVGSAGANLLLGGPGDDALNGGAGHDHVSGGDGTDRVAGGEGYDLCDVGAAADTVTGCEARTEVPLEIALHVRGRLLSSSGARLPDVDVSLGADPDIPLVTDRTGSDGRFELVVPSGGTWWLQSSRAGRPVGDTSPVPDTFFIRSRVDDNLPPVRGDADWNLTLGAVKLTVHVLDAAGAPVPGATVSLTRGFVSFLRLSKEMAATGGSQDGGSATTGAAGTVTRWVFPGSTDVTVDVDDAQLTLHRFWTQSVSPGIGLDVVVRP